MTRQEILQDWLDNEFRDALRDDARVLQAAAMLKVAHSNGDSAPQAVRMCIAEFVRELIAPGQSDRETVVRERKN